MTTEDMKELMGTFFSHVRESGVPKAFVVMLYAYAALAFSLTAATITNMFWG